MRTLPTENVMYQALLARDASFAGVFVVGVKTTSIFCLPTCPAKKPLAKNVEFFGTASDALHAGYRPCKRCRPTDHADTPPPWAQQLLDAIDALPAVRRTDADLRAMSIDPARARRFFKSRYGMTFHAYQRARRMGLALNELRQGEPITPTALRNGYTSDSGFRDAFHRLFGASPAANSAVRCLVGKWLDTPLGAMLALADDDGLAMLEFVDRRMIERQIATLRRRLRCTVVPGEHAFLLSIERELDAYFNGSLERFETPLNLFGSPFQRGVWERLMAIPYGRTDTYSAMAADIGRAGAQRAVGRANGDNRLAIIVPCHRVVRSDGSLCGYGGGLWRKRWLLEHEQQHER